MKTNLFTTAALAATLLAACSNDEMLPSAADAPVAADVTAAIAQTRAHDDTWDAQDAIGIYMLESGTATVSGGNANRRYVTPTATGNFSPADATQAIYFPMQTADKVDFRAYYPYATLKGDDYPIDLTDQTAPAAIDLMCSDNVTRRDKTDPVVALNFRHRLSRISVSVLAGSGFTNADLKGLTITLSNQPCTGTYRIPSDELNADDDKKTLTLRTAANGQSASAILMPQGGYPGRTLTFVMADPARTTFTYDLTSTKTFESGKETLYTIRLSMSGVEVSNAAISSWGSQGEISGEIDI